MRVKFIFVQSGREAWFEHAVEKYTKKLSHFTEFELRIIKAKGSPREQAQIKREKESEAILKELKNTDVVILFDENGRTIKDSIQFSKKIEHILESGKQQAVFVIGGAYGATEELRERANHLWSLSSLTMNHMVATTVALEQLYRGFTLLRGLPYHNV